MVCLGAYSGQVFGDICADSAVKSMYIVSIGESRGGLRSWLRGFQNASPFNFQKIKEY